MTTPELIAWLRENSSGIYRPAAEAADLIERLATISKEHDARAKMANFARCACDHCKALRPANVMRERTRTCGAGGAYAAAVPRVKCTLDAFVRAEVGQVSTSPFRECSCVSP